VRVGLLGNTELVGYLLLGKALFLAGLRDTLPHGFEELFVVAVHGHPMGSETSHESRAPFLFSLDSTRVVGSLQFRSG